MSTPSRQDPTKETTPHRTPPPKTARPALRRREEASPGRWFRDPFERLLEPFHRGWMSPFEGSCREWHWSLDVRENDDSVLVRTEAPGFEPEDFDIQVHGDELSVRAAHAEDKDEGDGGRRAWRSEDYCRTVTLPAAVDPDKVEAEYRNGVLLVTLPKAAGARSRRITVRGA